jgi:hypothetical protein
MGSLDWHYLQLSLFSAFGPAQMLLSKYGKEPHCGAMAAWSLAMSLNKRTATFSVHGTAFSGRARMPDELIGTIRQSDRIFVRFLPADPAVNHPDAWEWSLLFDAETIYVLVSFSILGSIILAILYAERRFVREGRPTVGTVTSCTFRARLFRLEYDFSKEDGTSIKGRGESRIPREIGSSIYVLYLPQNPRRSRPYPTPNFRVETN